MRWCTSCGSEVPDEMDACPVCGMPVEGAFDDDAEEPADDGPAVPSLVSAIPATPHDGTDVHVSAARTSRHRLMLVAALAAIAVVGGATLFITRPWNPHAYDTRATEDADTSMAGFPGEVSHLTSQDFVEDLKRKELGLQAEKSLLAYRDRLGRCAVSASVLERALDSTLESGVLVGADERAREALELDETLARLEGRMRGLVFEDEELGRTRDELLVLGSYLGGESHILTGAWAAVAGAHSAPDAIASASAILSRGFEGHSLDEWHNLFVNAYVTGHA